MQNKGRQIVKAVLLWLICSFLFVLPNATNAQQTTEKWGIAYKGMGGYVWAHTGQVTNLKAHVYGYSIGFRYKTANNKQWQRILNSPAWGVDYLYMNYGKPDILGSVHAVLPYMDFPMFRYKKWTLYLKTSVGLGYITKPFDANTNITNRTIGSHINAHMGLYWDFSYGINRNTDFLISGGITHFSNGNFNMPNLGVNTPNFSIGFTHYWGKKEITNPLPDDLDTSKHEYRFTIAAGKKNADYIFPKTIIPINIQFKYLYALSLKNKIGGGIDYFYDREYYYLNNRDKDYKKTPLDEASELGIKISHELQGKRMGLLSDLGFYLFNKNSFKSSFYQRLGFSYKVNREISVFTALKFYINSADYFEFGVNYSIFK